MTPGRRAGAARVAVMVASFAASGIALAGCGPAVGGWASSEGLAGTVTVLAAASLTESFDELAADFEEENPGVDVVLSYGGSSGLAEQIVTGGIPADVFASANESTMAAVVDAGWAPAPQPFATNVLALAVPVGNPAGVTGLNDLARPELAIALCDHAVPCGAATDELLALAGVTADPDTLELDVKAVLTRISLGEADAGLVYATDVAAAGDQLEAIAVPEAAVVVNRYPIAALREAPNPAAAAAFVAYVLGARGQAVLAAAGFGAP